MTASVRMPCFLLALALAAAGSAQAGPADDLLPPPVRQTEKRSLGSNDERLRRSYYDGRGASGAAFSPDGKLLITANNYQGMNLWDVGSGRTLGQFPNAMRNEGLSAAFTPNGKQFVLSSWGNNGNGCPVTLWDVGRRERARSLDEDVNDTPFSTLAVAPDGKTVALAAGMGGRRNEPPAICFWDLASGDEVGRVEGLISVDPTRPHLTARFEALAYSPDGRTVAALLEGRIVLVEVATGRQRGQLGFAAASRDTTAERQQGIIQLGALAFAPDGRTLVAGCPDGAIRRFDLKSGHELTPLSGHSSPVLALCCTPDGQAIHSYGFDGQFFAWRTDAGGDWKPKGGALPEPTLEALWEVLRTDDARDLYGCLETLAASPAQTVPFLRKRLTPVAKGDQEHIDKLIADLQKGDYNARKKAVLELRKLGAAAAPALRKSQERGYDELTRRMIMEFDTLAPPPEQQRAVRALAVLERIGSSEARQLLEELGDGAPEAGLTIQAKAALERLGKAEPVKTTEGLPEALWEALAGEDPVVAYRAVRALANRPTAAPLLQEHLKTVASKDIFNDDPKRLAKLIANLDSDDFAVREQATKDLRNLGKAAVPALRKSLEAKPGAEGKRRLEALLEEAAKASTPPEVLRVGRALEALEMMGGAEARPVLELLAKDASVGWLREAAAEALRRQGEAKR